MTYVWIGLWLIFAAAVLAFIGRSLNVVLTQKKAWQEFAARYKLDYIPGKRLMQPAGIAGRLNNRRIEVYSQAEQYDNERTASNYTHVEVGLNTMPGVAMIISKRALPRYFGTDFRLNDVFTSPGADWPQPAVSMTDDAQAMAKWMTPGRMRGLKAFMDSAGRFDEPIFISEGNQAFLMWRTTDPLNDPRALNALVQKLYGFARDLDGLEPSTGTTAKPNAPSEPSEPA
jgi:hypothetical protein